MKRTLLATLLLTSLTVNAGSLIEAVTKNCAIVSNFGGVVMKARQLGYPRDEALTISGNDEYLKSIVIDAYKVDRYGIKSAQNKAIASYKETVMTECVTNIGYKSK